MHSLLLLREVSRPNLLRTLPQIVKFTFLGKVQGPQEVAR